MLFSAFALLVCFIALSRYRYFIRSPMSLLPLKNTASITAALIGEPKPAGQYYAVNCRVRAVYDKRGNKFSAHGNAKIFFPRALIEQNLSGGISLIASNNNDDDSDCRIFASGVVLKAAVRYAANENGLDCFFAEKDLPQFLAWNSPLEHIRGTLRFHLMRLLFSWGNAGALLLALIAADKNFLAPEVHTAFITCGLAHVLALSGMHISIVSTASRKISGGIFSKKLTDIISLIAIIMFVWFAGESPSLTRALGMAAILICTRLITVKISVMSAMSLMFVLHLLFKPEDALSISFMLSYGALAGILLFGEALNTIAAGKAPPYILQSFTASFGAQMFTLPIIAFTLKRVSLIGLLSSSLISPLIGWFLIFGLLAVFLSAVCVPLAPILGILLNYFYNGIMQVVNVFAGIFNFTVQDTAAAMLFVIVPIFLGILCMYFQNKIVIRRAACAKSAL